MTNTRGEHWYRVRYRRHTGYVRGDLLTATKPAPPSRPRSVLVPVLMYHNVGYGWGRYQVTMPAFQDQLNWLQNNGYHTVTMSQVFDYMYDGHSLSSRPVVLTFDDGWASQWGAAQELRARGMVGVFFVMSQGIGLSDAQLKTLVSWGDELGDHTITHPDLTRVSDQQLHQEVAWSKQQLESRLGVPIHFFAYPYGAYDNRVVSAVAAAGYRGAMAAWGPNYGAFSYRASSRWYEPRVEISGYATLSEFAARVNAAAGR